MRIHKEGYPTITLTLLLVASILALAFFVFNTPTWVKALAILVSLFLLVAVLQFFRNPKRKLTILDNAIIAPADGKVVVIENTMENEYFKDMRKQVSIFMSPTNVHVNRYPISGIVKYCKYHPGKYLVAWHPKSSTENERTSIVVETPSGTPVLFRQIAGALARRIVFYSKENQKAEQGQEFGFIKFGSRIDLYLPLNAEITVNINDKVKGGQTIIANIF